ncbi:hypothetical protein FSP39_015188 [Pinctada imbricata]|uniref:Fibronectin type-III domain-containing protein n=1 Tax=Pinctada imbricata TaxID=66713 RepID=A0AA88XD41_PINIB|nr:hypothetical protein FSP39_015188 [Pinctada imbricata]
MYNLEVIVIQQCAFCNWTRLCTNQNHVRTDRNTFMDSGCHMTTYNVVVPGHRYIRPRVPISRPEIWEEEPYKARLRWNRVYTPPYHHIDTPIRYQIEVQEPPRRDWRSVARGITMTEHEVSDLTPRKDYLFRIRAELPNGEVSDPTPPIAEIAQELGLREDDDEDDATTPTQDNYKSEISFEISELNKLSNVGRMSRTFSQSMSGSLPSGDTFSESYTQDIKGPEYIQFKQKSSVYDVSDFRGENYNFSSDTTTRPDELNYLQNLSSSSSYIPTFQENKFDKNSKVYTSSSVNYSPKPNRKLIVKEMSLVTPESSKPSYVSNDQFQVKDYHKEQSNGGGHHLDQSEKDMFRKDLEQVLKTRSQPNSDSDEEEEYDESFLNDRTYAIIAEHALRRGSEKYGFASDDLIDVLSTIMEESDYHGSENVSLCGESVNGGDEQTSNGLPSFDVDDALSALERNRDSKDSEEFWKKYFQVDNRPSLTFTSNRAEKDIEDQQEHDVQSFDTRSVAQTNQSSKEVDVVVKEYEALSKRVDDILQKYRHFRNPSASDFQSSRLDVKQNNETESENYSLDYKPETSTDKSYRSTSYGYRLHSAIENTCNDKKETDASAEKYFETKESISPKTTKKKTIEEVIKAAEDLLSEEDDLDVSRRIRKRKKARRFNLTKWKDNEFSSDDDSVASAIENRASQLSLQILNKPDINCDVSDLRFSKDSGTNCTALKREKEETTHELREHDITKKGEVDLSETTKGTDQTLIDGSSSSSPYEELNSIASRLNKLKDRNQNVAGELERGHYALDFMRNEENSYQSLPEPSLKLESDTKNRDRTSSGYSYEDSSSKLEKRYDNLSSVSSFDSVFQDSSVIKDVASPESQSVLDDDSYSSVSMYRRRLSRRSLTETCLSPEFKKDLESSRSTRSIGC